MNYEVEQYKVFMSKTGLFDMIANHLVNHLVDYALGIDTGDYVIVVNADKVKVTGKKLDQKIYYHHSDYIGGCLLYTSGDGVPVSGASAF